MRSLGAQHTAAVGLWGGRPRSQPSKTLTVSASRTALRNGMDVSPGPFVFDTGHAVAIDFFAEGTGIGISELTRAGDFIVVPDPLTFRVLPHKEACIGWFIGDEYLRDGRPYPLSGRAVLRRQLDSLAERSLDLVIGIEIEWIFTRFLDGGRPGAVGGFGIQGVPPLVAAVNAGCQFNSRQASRPGPAGMPAGFGCADAILGMVLAGKAVVPAADGQPFCCRVHGGDGQNRALAVQQ